MPTLTDEEVRAGELLGTWDNAEYYKVEIIYKRTSIDDRAFYCLASAWSRSSAGHIIMLITAIAQLKAENDRLRGLLEGNAKRAPADSSTLEPCPYCGKNDFVALKGRKAHIRIVHEESA